MDVNFDEYFKRYEALVQSVDTAFKRVEQQYSQQVTCHIGCDDCCYALFDVTLIEALYINHRLHSVLTPETREDFLEKCNKADRQTYKIKKQAWKRFEEGLPEDEILTAIAAERVRCPCLNDQNQCDIYAFRPLTCRLYGIPTAIAGKGHTCGRSGFEAGQPYPTVNMDTLHQKLYAISSDLVRDLDTPYIKLAEVLVPLSMALLTEYNDAYFGLEEDTKIL